VVVETDPEEETHWCERCGVAIDADLLEGSGHRLLVFEFTIGPGGVKDFKSSLGDYCPGPVVGMS
jgi:hypothetical protein